MLTPRLRAAWGVAVAACAAIALVSGTVFVIATAVGSDNDGSDAATDGPWQRSIAWPVAVRRGSDPRTAVVVYDVPAGQPDCFRKPAARVDRETAEAVHISLTYEIGRLDCTLTSRDQIRVSARGQLRNRDVVVNGEAWTPRGRAYKRCTNTGCSPPPPPQCTSDQVDEAMRAIDTEGERKVRACTARWLIADVTSGGSTRRWFFEYHDKTWHPLLGTRNRACSSVRRTQPAFPADLCRSLPLPA